MKKLKNLSKLYGNNIELFSEKGFLDAVIYMQEWNKFTDIEKVEKRKSRLEYNEIHFNDSIQENKKYAYEKSVITITELIMLFIEKTNSVIETEKNILDNYLMRITNLLYCEKFLINNVISYRMINHIPYEIFEPLIEKFNTHQQYKLYGLDKLFGEYKNMMELYHDKPYE